MRAFPAAALLLAAAADCAEGPQKAGRKAKAKQGAWSYADTYEWQNTYPTCGGSRQSPIALEVANAEMATPGFWKLFIPRRAPTPLTLMNIGTSVQLDVEKRGITLTSSSLQSQYSMMRMNWHVPSEHAIEGKRYPLERQLVFWPSDYQVLQRANINNFPIVIVSELYQIGSDDAGDPTLERVVEKLPYVQSPDSEPVQLQDFFPTFNFQTDEFFTYQGSMTSPPCLETVTWFVSSKIHTASMQQVTTMRDTISLQVTSAQPLSGCKGDCPVIAPEGWNGPGSVGGAFVWNGNARPVRPLNNRCVPSMDPSTNCTEPVKLRTFRGPR